MTNDHALLTFLQIIVTALATITASSGFWLYLDKKRSKNDLTRKLLIGLAHDRIVSLSIEYIARGYVTTDEYENLLKYLYEPYKELGGNGTTSRLMGEVVKLKIVTRNNPVFQKGENNDQ